MILVDTNVLYALADRRDKHHARCAGWLKRTPDVLMVPATVLAETCYLIDRTLGPAAEAAFLDSVGVKTLARYADSSGDAFETMRKAGRALGLPVTLVIDKDGCEVAAVEGGAKWDSAEAQALVEALKGG